MIIEAIMVVTMLNPAGNAQFGSEQVIPMESMEQCHQVRAAYIASKENVVDKKPIGNNVIYFEVETPGYNNTYKVGCHLG